MTYVERVLAGEIEGPLFQHVNADGTFTDYTFDEVMASSKMDLEKALWLQERIEGFKHQLVDTDYIALKLAEGAATTDEYADKISARQTLRDTINTYQETLDALGVQL